MYICTRIHSRRINPSKADRLLSMDFDEALDKILEVPSASPFLTVIRKRLLKHEGKIMGIWWLNGMSWDLPAGTQLVNWKITIFHGKFHCKSLF